MNFSDLKIDDMFILNGKIGYKMSDDTAYIPELGAAANFNMLPDEKIELNDACKEYNARVY